MIDKHQIEIDFKNSLFYAFDKFLDDGALRIVTLAYAHDYLCEKGVIPKEKDLNIAKQAKQNCRRDNVNERAEAMDYRIFSATIPDTQIGRETVEYKRLIILKLFSELKQKKIHLMSVLKIEA